jgi:hypothetical protein
MAKTQLELEIEQQELDAQKKAAAKEKKDAADAESNRLYCRNKFREVTAPLVEWAGAEYFADQALKFTFRDTEYQVSVDHHYSNSRMADDCPEIGWTSAWFLHGKGKKEYIAGDWANFFPDRDGRYGYGRGPIKEQVVKGIKDIDEQIERDRHRR